MSFPKNRAPHKLAELYRWQQEYALEIGGDVARIQYRIAAAAIIAACAVHDDQQPAIVLKGGAALDARYGDRARFSTDVDFSIRAVVAPSGRNEMERRLGIGWEGFEFDLRGSEQIASHQAWRYDLRVQYLGKPYKQVRLEIGEVAGDDMIVEMIDAPIDLRAFGLASAPHLVPALDLHEQVAQKLHACTTRFESSENERVRDLPDLHLITSEAFDLRHQRVVCERVFVARARQAWPPQLEPEPRWPQLYAEMLEAHPQIEPKSLNEAVAYVRRLITAIDDAR